MAPTKKSKAAKSTESIAARLALVVKSGKYTLGYKSALKQMRSGKGTYHSIRFSRGLEREAEKVPGADLFYARSKTRTYCWKLPAAEKIGAGVLCYALKDNCASFLGHKRRTWDCCWKALPCWVSIFISILSLGSNF